MLVNTIKEEFSRELHEYKRPWKLCSLACGVSLLIIGAFYYDAPDWDIPISLIMATLAYLTSSWSLRILIERKWRYFPAMLFFTWFTVDGCYWIYWSIQDPQALEFMREVNFMASLSLYVMCGLIWLYRGPLKNMIHDIKTQLRR